MYFDIKSEKAPLLNEPEKIKVGDRAYLEWSNVSYYVPLPRRSRLDQEIEDSDMVKGLPLKQTKLIKGNQYKEIVH